MIDQYPYVYNDISLIVCRSLYHSLPPLQAIHHIQCASPSTPILHSYLPQVSARLLPLLWILFNVKEGQQKRVARVARVLKVLLTTLTIKENRVGVWGSQKVCSDRLAGHYHGRKRRANISVGSGMFFSNIQIAPTPPTEIQTTLDKVNSNPIKQFPNYKPIVRVTSIGGFS